jgi:hypothetical protein
MEPSTRGSEPTPVRHSPPSPDTAAAEPADDVWFELRGRDGTVTGTSTGVVHRRMAGDAWAVHEWAYADLRSLHVSEAGEGGSIVIEPRRGPLVPIAIGPDEREEAFQAATVFNLLIARADRSSPIRNAVRR